MAEDNWGKTLADIRERVRQLFMFRAETLFEMHRFKSAQLRASKILFFFTFFFVNCQDVAAIKKSFFFKHFQSDVVVHHKREDFKSQYTPLGSF